MRVVSKNNVKIVGAEDGPTIMLAHGFGCDQNLWRLVTPRLAPRFRIVLFDHVGSGDSDPDAWDDQKYSSLDGYAADVLDIANELKLREVVFVGHSVAAMIGVLAVAADPSRFAKLVLLTPSPRYLDGDGYRGGFSRADIDELLVSLESNYLGWSRAMAPTIMGTPDRPELGDELGETFCRTDPHRASVFARTTFLSDNRADLSRVAIPTLVIECAQDTLAPREVGSYVHQHISNSQLVTLDATGHCPPSERSGRHGTGDRGLRSPAVTPVPDGGGSKPLPDSDGLEDLYENAPCGYLSASPDGRIVRVNATLAELVGYERNALLGRRVTDLLSVGARIHYETHFAPMLHINRQVQGIAVELVAADGARVPVFLTANVKAGVDGEAVLLRIVTQDARDRRSYERELLDARERAENERARVQLLATTLQRSLVPPVLLPPDGLDACAYLHTASSDEVGGDFYDLFPLTPNKWGFFLGDVSGKGAGAAAVTSLVRYTLRAAAVYDSDPVAVLKNLDTVLNHEFHGDDPRFCTVIFGVLTGRANTVSEGFDIELATGGHPPALLLHGDGHAHYVQTPGGQAVGMLPNAQFVATRIHLTAGDTLVLYTDGLTEARTGIGIDRYDDRNALLGFARAHSPTTAAAIIADIRSLLDSFGAGLQDDAAVLALGVPSL